MSNPFLNLSRKFHNGFRYTKAKTESQIAHAGEKILGLAEEKMAVQEEIFCTAREIGK
ncbi:MAG: hypothetical protein JST85_23535 [Acidobacteria bacterium]|nr:hypothetical protein [Acidobacteriota bacterium]